MDVMQIIFGLGITILWTTCAIMSKEAVIKGQTVPETTLSNSIWIVAAAIIISCIYWESDFVPFLNRGSGMVFPLFMSFCKGISVHLVMTSFSYISRRSVSSGAFALTSGLPVGSLICAFFLGEILSGWDIFAVLAIGLASFFFFMKGHAKELDGKDKLAYAVLVAAVSFNMVADRISGVNCSWAVHLLVYNLSWLGINLIQFFISTPREKLLEINLLTKPLVLLGISYVVNEINLIYSMQQVFNGVVAPFIFLRVATPIIMLIGAVKYGEGNWRDQLLFGFCVLIPATISIVL